MSYESTAEPIKIGYLMDFLLGDYPKEMYEDLTIPFDMVFQDAGSSTVGSRSSTARWRDCRRARLKTSSMRTRN